MKFITLLIALSILFFSCKTETSKGQEEVEETMNKSVQKVTDSTKSTIEKTITPKAEEGEIVIDGKTFKEYYPGAAKKIKFTGEQDENGKRHGKWLYFSEEGMELSITNYSHGKRNGFSLVKYPNGSIHYTGEYLNDETVGIWKTYSPDGVQISEKDYGYPE